MNHTPLPGRAPVAPGPSTVRPVARRSLAGPALRASLLAACTALAVAIPREAHASAPSSAEGPEQDPLDTFLDRSLGDRAFEERPTGSFTLGLEMSLQVSSQGTSSFGGFAFVQVPFERLARPSRRSLTGPAMFAEGPKKGTVDTSSALTPEASRAARQRAVTTAAPGGGDAATPAKQATSARASATTATSAATSRADARPGNTTATTTAATSTTATSTTATSTTATSTAATSTTATSTAATSTSTTATSAAAAPVLTPDLARGAVRAACKAQHIDDADARLDGLASRSRTSALLPELRLRATRSIDESESLAPTEYDPFRRTASGGSTTWLEARATFRLDRLVFADDELDVERQRMARAAQRTKLVAKVLDLLDAWQTAHTSAVDPDAAPAERTRATLAEASAVASLDVLTDGWFSKALEAPSPRHTDRDTPVTSGGDGTASALSRDMSRDTALTAPDASHPSAASASAR